MDLLNRLECEAIDRRERDIEKLYYYSFFFTITQNSIQVKNS